MQLAHVRWLGGGSGAAKSTVAVVLAQRHGLHLVDTDALMADHAARASSVAAPQLARFAKMTMDERWLLRPPQEMLETFHWFRGEGFDLIVDDLLALPDDQPVLVEGFRLLPRLVGPLLSDPAQAVWLLPTPSFRRAAFAARGSLDAIAGRTSDPPGALENLLARDALFTERLRHDVAGLGLHAFDVDGSLTQDALVSRLEEALGL